MPRPQSLHEVMLARPLYIVDRLKQISVNANFMNTQLMVRDGVLLNVYVRHQGFDLHGNPLPDDGSCFPGEKDTKQAKQVNSSADPGVNFSDDTSEEIDYNDDADDQTKVHTHMFTIDMVARYPDLSDDLILHWGLSRTKTGAWGSPDASFFPKDSQKWPDGLAAQSVFQRDQDNKCIRTITAVLKWVVDVDQPITSISYVLTEKNKNCWHSIGGGDQVIVFSP